MPNITITQEVREVNITITQSGQSYTLQPVLVVNGGGGGGGAVTSVNGQIGAVLLKTDDISDAGEVNKYTSQADIDRLADTSGTNTGDQVLPTNTSDLINDGADGINPFITAADVPADAVTSVNGEVGVVVLSTDNIADTTTNRYTNDTDIARLLNTSGTNTGDQDISGIGVNAADIDLIEAEQITQNNAIALNTAKETNATHTGDATGATALTLQPTAISGKGANVGLIGTEEVLINNAGTLEKTTTQDIANLGGGGGGGGKTFIHISGAVTTVAYPDWITWQGTGGYYLTTWNTAVDDDGSGTPIYKNGDKGILIPKGFKVNRIVWNHLTANAGEFETLAILNKPLTVDVGDYKVYPNGDFEGLSINSETHPNRFEIYRELYYDAPLNPFTRANSRQFKREMICTTAGGANEADTNDCQLQIYFRRDISNVTASVRFSGFIEIEPI